VFTSIEVSLVRERNERLLQEIQAGRMGRSPDRDPGPGPHRGFWPRGFAFSPGRLRRAGGGGGA
jgi:hypothetical protein